MATCEKHSDEYAAEALEKVMGDRKDGRILDVACGTGLTGKAVSITCGNTGCDS